MRPEPAGLGYVMLPFAYRFDFCMVYATFRGSRHARTPLPLNAPMDLP